MCCPIEKKTVDAPYSNKCNKMMYLAEIRNLVQYNFRYLNIFISNKLEVKYRENV